MMTHILPGEDFIWSSNKKLRIGFRQTKKQNYTTNTKAVWILLTYIKLRSP